MHKQPRAGETFEEYGETYEQLSLFLVERHVTTDYSIEVEAASEEEAQDKAREVPLQEWTCESQDTFWEVNKV